MTRRVSSIADRVLIGCFLALVYLPLADTFLRIDDTPAPEEQRLPAAFPIWADVGRAKPYLEKLEAYFNDHFGYRRYFIKWYHKRRRQVFGADRAAGNRAMTGKDGWLYYAGHNMVENHRATNPFTPDDLERWKTALEKRRDWLKARGIRYLVVFAPNKESIYPEHLPSWLQRVGKQSRKDQVVAYLSERSDVPFIDLEPVLRRGKNHDILYWKTDSHWNDAGAFLAYQEIMRRLSAWYPSLAPDPLSAFTVTHERKPAGNLAAMIGQERTFEDGVPTYRRRAGPEPVDGALPPLAGEEAGERTMPPLALETPGRKLRVLFVRDSFTEALRPFLAPHFARSLYIYTMFLNGAVVEKEKPDLVIQEIVENFLSTTVTVDFERKDRLPG